MMSWWVSRSMIQNLLLNRIDSGSESGVTVTGKFKSKVVMNKKVSIIMPCYNQGAYVKEAIESVLNQTYKNIEIVCVNDASSDNSVEIIQGICRKEYHIPIIFINHFENKGVVATRNEAIEKATGDYILPLDADDTLEPTFVEKAVKILDENSDVGIVYCWVNNFWKDSKSQISKWEDFDVNKELFLNSIVNTSMFRKSDFLLVGGYKDYMDKGWEDWDLWLSIIENGFKAHLIKEVLFNYRRNFFNSRSNSAAKSINHLYRELLRHHTELYLNNDCFIDRVFNHDYQIKRILNRYRKMCIEVVSILIMFYLIMFIYLML